MWLLIERQEDYEDYYILRGIYNSTAEAIYSVDNYEEDRNLAVAETFFGEVDLEELAEPEIERKSKEYHRRLKFKKQEEHYKLLSSHNYHLVQDTEYNVICLTCVKVFNWLFDHYEEEPIKDFNSIKKENNRRKAEQVRRLEVYKKQLEWLKKNQPDSGLIPIMESEIERKSNG